MKTIAILSVVNLVDVEGEQPPVVESPVCGSAAKEYFYEDADFEGDFCQAGIVVLAGSPTFPNAEELTSGGRK